MRLNWKELHSELEVALNANHSERLITLLHNALALTGSYELAQQESQLITTLVNESLDLLSMSSRSPESMTEKIKALRDQLGRVLEHTPPKKMVGQEWLMSKMEALNYKITGLGECYGFSQMAMQAFFSKDMETFNRRIELIYQMPSHGFFGDFLILREQKNQFSLEGRQDKADEINDLIVDLYAFFDGVALNQYPMWYLLGEDYQPLSQKQDIRKTGLITRPVALETKDEHGHFPNQPIMLSPLTGAYELIGLRDYVALLKNNLGGQSFSLNLIANMHSILLAYDAKTTRWLLVDPSNLPGEEYIDEAYLSNALWTALLGNCYNLKTLVMGTQISVLASDEILLQQQFETLRTSEQWLRLHKLDVVDQQYPALTMDRLALFGFSFASESPKTLMKLLYDNPDTVFTAPMDLLNIAVFQRDYSTAAQIMITKGVIASPSDFQIVFSSLSTQQQNELLDSLGIDLKVELIHFGVQIVMNIIKEKPEEFAVIFACLSPHGQSLALEQCIEEALQIKLLNELSIEQKKSIINASSCKFASSLFLLLSDAERVSVFRHIEPRRQANCLLHAGNQRSNLFDMLSTQDKESILTANLDTEEIIHFFLLLSEQDQISMFSKLQFFAQGLLFLSLTPPTHIELINVLLGTLSIDDKSEIINYMWDEQAIREFFFLLTDLDQLSIIQTLPSSIQVMLLAGMFDKPQQQEALILALSFNQKKDMIDCYTTMDSYYRSTDSYEQLIIKLIFNNPVAQTDLVVASVELTSEESPEKISHQTLTEILAPLGLTKETMTPFVLKRSFKKFHPDTANSQMHDVHHAFDDIKLLQTFMSTTGLIHYRDDEKKRVQVRDRLSGITPDEQLFLVKKSIESIQTELGNMHRRNEINQFLTLTRQAYETKDLSFFNTLNILSCIARAMIHPDEAEESEEMLGSYKDLMSTLWGNALDRLMESTRQYDFIKQNLANDVDIDNTRVNRAMRKQILDLKAGDEHSDLRPDDKLKRPH